MVEAGAAEDGPRECARDVWCAAGHQKKRTTDGHSFNTYRDLSLSDDVLQVECARAHARAARRLGAKETRP